ncbi:alginate O-acetyltransferase AlgX-related protein [Marinicella litoralis]|uniref:Acetyltransferase AlgX (SGNH hydrolase-like protein) n=1 Tax=Marinicella litoralis TaxID=644220 RepID=A0A4R6XRZ5_9GAMM|nr:hypothetical protein [Marinicella litoralis]TDR22526.1 acetyltransferase AlgX (SGNH hydrolase-like protein) [Marinicella litoralis]
MNKSTANLTFIGLFLLCLLLPGLVALYHSQGLASNQEKRSLAAAPDFPATYPALQAWPGQVDAYYQDNFGLRSTLLAGYYKLKLWLKDATGTDVIYGSKEGWLFYNNPVEDPIGDFRNINQFTVQNLNEFISVLKTKQQWLAQQGIEYLFVITPSKHYIYPEYLPSHLKPLQQKNIKQQLAEALMNHPEIHFLDLTDTLLEHKKKQLLYFKADTHWNYYAAEIAQRKIIQTVNHILDLNTPIRHWSDDEFKFQFDHEGDLAFLLHAGPHFAEPLFKPEFSTCAHIGFDQLLKPRSQYSTVCDANVVNVLIFHDSFFNLLQPFISTHFSEVSYLKQKFNFKSATQAISNNKPGIVIEQYIDRKLPQIDPP